MAIFPVAFAHCFSLCPWELQPRMYRLGARVFYTFKAVLTLQWDTAIEGKMFLASYLQTLWRRWSFMEVERNVSHAGSSLGKGVNILAEAFLSCISTNQNILSQSFTFSIKLQTWWDHGDLDWLELYKNVYRKYIKKLDDSNTVQCRLTELMLTEGSSDNRLFYTYTVFIHISIKYTTKP